MASQSKIAVGTDIEEVERFRLLIDKHGLRFLQKIFSESEIQYCQSKKDGSKNFAARFAAKEAVIKAVSHIERFDLKHVEILNDQRGKPRIKLHGAKTVDDNDLAVSLSHTSNYAVAMVVYSPIVR